MRDFTPNPAQFEVCYKFEMAKTIEQWLLFKYVSGEFTPL
jgi:hypothetical protein